MQAKGDSVGSRVRTLLLFLAGLTWGSVYLASLLEHFQVPSQFDTAFTTLIGAILVSARKKGDTPKD